MKNWFLYLGLLLVLISSCQPASHFRIRTGDIIRDYELLHVRDSTLIVQDWSAHGDYMWRTVAHIPLREVSTLWHPEANRNRNIQLGAGIGLGIAVGATYLIPWGGSDYYAPVGALLLGGPLVMAAGAIIGSSLPADDLILLPEDPETLYFLEDHQLYREVEDMPGVLREKALK